MNNVFVSIYIIKLREENIAAFGGHGPEKLQRKPKITP